MQIISNREEHNKDSGTRVTNSSFSAFDFSHLLDRKVAATSERADLIQQFVDAINKTSNKKFSWRVINGVLRHCDTRDLYMLYKECSNGRCFGSLFWYKVKKNTKPVEKPVDD